MSIWRLVTREISYRRLNFFLAVVAVTVAVGVLVALLVTLDSHEIRTRQILDDMATRQAAELKKMLDDYRKITKELGFNVLILPKKQDIAEYHRLGYGTEHMPAKNATLLAESPIVTVRHLLPTLEQTTDWPERNVKVTLVGTHGELPAMERDPKKPILRPVERGQIVVGHGLGDMLKLKAGDRVKFKGADLTVARVFPRRGTREDFTAWVDLALAQKLLDKEGLINAIWALECHCAWADLEKVRAEITKILPETQIAELASKAQARAKARNTAQKTMENELARETERRNRFAAQRRDLVALLAPLVILGCAVWVALLAFSNARQRRHEIGILRAIGLRSRHILTVFLIRAVLIGLLGAVLGYAGGFGVGARAGGAAVDAASTGRLFHAWVLAAVIAAAPLLAALASWAPAIFAAQQDPAVILSRE